MNGKQLKNSILQWAIQGKLVPQDPNDEPASVLLDRIRKEKARLVREKQIKKDKNESIIYRGEDNSYYEKFLTTGKVKCIDEEIPFELPINWRWVRGKTVFLPMESTKPTSDFIYIDVNAVNNKQNIIDNPKKLKPSNAPSRATRKLHENDVLFSMVRPYLKNIALVDLLYKDAIASTGFYVITPSVGYYPKFLFYLMLSNYVVDGLNLFMKGDNSPSINNCHIEDFLYPLPPLQEQHRIVTKIKEVLPIVDKYEKAQEALDKLNAEIKDKLKRSILQEAIHGRLVPQDPADEPASALLERINPKAEIVCDNGDYPNGWQCTILGDIFNHNTGKALNSSNKEGIMKSYLTTSNVYWNEFDFTVIKQMPYKESELDKCTVTKGDLLVCEGGDIGRSAIWNYDYDICIQNHIHRLRPKGDLCVVFYYYVLFYLKGKNLIGGKGMGLLGLSSDALHKINVPLPPLAEQQRIVRKVEELFSALDNIQKALEA